VEPVLIDNGKKPNEFLNISQAFWLPSANPFCNFQLKLFDLIQRLDEANRRLLESFTLWTCVQNARVSGAMLLGHEVSRHHFASEQAVYLIRRTADELISLIYCLSYWETAQDYPQQIKIDCIGAALQLEDSSAISQIVAANKPLLSLLNDISNAFKHSFVNSDANLIGAEEPCIFVQALERNNLKTHKPVVHSTGLNKLAVDFNVFYKQCVAWLLDFSNRHVGSAGFGQNAAKVTDESRARANPGTGSP
jgi:hypothetical protein